MPYTPSRASVIQATLLMRMNGQRMMNVLHYKNTLSETGSFDDGEALLDELRTQIDEAESGWSFKLASFSTDDLKIDTLKLQVIWPVRYAYKDYTANNTVGTQALESAPQNISCAVTLQCDEAGRHAHGTIKVPGLAAQDVADGRIAPIITGHMTSLASFLKGPFVTEGQTGNWQAVIYNRQTPANSLMVTHNAVAPEARVIRRRTVGLGI